MVRYRWIAALLAVWLGMAWGATCEAKPPDPEQPAPAYLDAWCPCMLPLLTQELAERLGAMMWSGAKLPVDMGAPGPSDMVRSRVDPGFAASAEKARLLYELASRCLREGKLAEARAHLREAHLANPTCRFGRMAIGRLQELEALPTGEEASEPGVDRPRTPPTQDPAPPLSRDARGSPAERAFQQVLGRTEHLGLVPMPSY